MDAPAIVEVLAGYREVLGDGLVRLEAGATLGRGRVGVELVGGLRVADAETAGQIVWVYTMQNDGLIPLYRDDPWNVAGLLTWAPFGVGATGVSLSAGPEVASMRYHAIEDDDACCADVDETPFFALGLATRFSLEADARRVGARVWVGDRLDLLDEPDLYDAAGPRVVSEWRGGLDVVGGTEWAQSWSYGVPGVRLGVGLRPAPALEIQIAAAELPAFLGASTHEGRALGDCFCWTDLREVASARELTIGVWPAHATHGAWEIAAGVRAGAGLFRERFVRYGAPDEDPAMRAYTEDYAWRAGLVLAAAVEATRGHAGVRLHVERWTVPDLDAMQETVVYDPGLEGFLRW